MYCGINEAYTNNDNMDQLGGFDNYTDIDIHNHFMDNYKQYNMAPAYFTAQGDISDKHGTSINDLKRKFKDSESILSDSDFSLDSSMSQTKSINDSDNSSLFSLKTMDSSKSKLTPKQCKCQKTTVIPEKSEIREYFDTKNLGYTIKELLIIILAGIILIFVLDLLVRIGKKMNK